MAAPTSARKRPRPSKDDDSDFVVSSQEEDVSEDSGSEYTAPVAKRPRRASSSRIRKQKSAPVEEAKEDSNDPSDDADDAADDLDSDVENTNTTNTSNKSPKANGNVKKLQSRVVKLEKENKRLKAEVTRLTKQVKSLTACQKKEVKKTQTQTKKVFQSLSKQLIRVAKKKSNRFYGCGDIVVEQTMDKEVFAELFNGKGHKIQPLPDNKPKSVKTIISFDGWEDVHRLFADYGVEIERRMEVSLWRMGSIFRGKSRYLGKRDANVDCLTVEYNRSSGLLKLSFVASLNYDDESPYMFF